MLDLGIPGVSGPSNSTRRAREWVDGCKPLREPVRRRAGPIWRKALCVGRGFGARMKDVIPAAGLGTRFLPYTKAMPKEMIPIVDKPAIQFVVEEAVASG